MAKSKLLNVQVLVDDTHKAKLLAVTKALKGKGFVLKETLSEVGVLTGSVPASKMSSLSTVAGVSAVEEERSDYRTQE